MKISEVTRQMRTSGVLGAGRLGRAARILTLMFKDQSFSNILTLAGPMVAGGLRRTICDLISRDNIHALVTTGANVTHDLIEAFGHRHIRGSTEADDRVLRRRGLARIYDIYITQRSIEYLEKRTYRILDDISEARRRNIGTFELLWEFGKRIHDDKSIVATAFERRVPVFCPGIIDSMLGLNLWTYSRLKPLVVNPLLDFGKLVDMTYDAKKVGVIILGGGMPKHHALVASIYRGGIDAAVQITLDRPEGGGTSGAPLEEAISWGKVRNPKNLETVIGDSTIVFPLLVATAWDESRTQKIRR